MEQFAGKFKEDATDLIKTMEEDLLLLKDKPQNKNLIESIFRSIHTLKGAGAMFGFENIAILSHDLENIYELIQSKKLTTNKRIIDITFSAIDFFKYLLENKNFENSEIEDKFQKLRMIIDNLVGKKSSQSDEKNIEIKKNIKSTYYIKFTPKANFEERGINLFGLFEELEEIGNIEKLDRETKPENNPSDEYFYMFWEIILVTNKDISEVEEVFIFFQKQVEITKIHESNLFECNKFNKEIERIRNTDELIDLEYLRENGICKTVEKIPKEIKHEDLELPTILQEAEDTAFKKYKTTSIRVESRRLDELMNLVSEFITTKATINIIAEKYEIKELNDAIEKFDKLAQKFQENALSIRLVPIRNMLIDIERLVTQLSQKMSKKVKFVSQGTDTELDKSIIDNLAEPIMHIIRNTIDHGIELADERIAKGKSPEGEVKFIAFYSGGNVFIQIHDDGRGIDLDRVRQKAIIKNIINNNDKLSKRELLNLVFTPGFSTSETVTDISGRGMGMDIVKQKIQNLRGDVEINTEKNLGTYITLRLPVTLSILDTLQIIIDNKNYLIPKYIIEHIFVEKDLSILEESKSVIEINGETTPILNLVKRYSKSEIKPETVNIVVVKYKDDKYGLIVDDIVEDHQAVLKPLGEILNEQEIFSGASILGNGKIALVFDTNKLISTWK